MNHRIRRIAAGLTLAASTITGTALATTAAHADDAATTPSASTVDDQAPAPAPKTTGPVATPFDTWWG